MPVVAVARVLEPRPILLSIGFHASHKRQSVLAGSHRITAHHPGAIDKYMNAGPGRLWNPNNQASPHGLSWRNCSGRRKSHTFAKHHQHETELQRPEDSLAF
jgi:hypothetical protein